MAAVRSDSSDKSLLDYLAIAKRRLGWLVVPIALLVALAVLYTLNQPPRYEATARVLLADTASQRTLDPSSQNTGFLTRELSNEISLARSDGVESLVIGEIGELPDVEITSDSTADVLVFNASAPTAEDAARFVNVWADKYVQVKQDDAVSNINSASDTLQQRLEGLRLERQEIRAPLDELDQQISRTADPDAAARLQRDYDRLADDLRYELELVTGQAEATIASLSELELQAELSSVGEARIIQVAAPPDSTSNSSLAANVPLAIILGAIIGGALALLAEARDNTIKSAGDIQSITDLPVLASIPKPSRREKATLAMATLLRPDGVHADGFHKVRSSLEFMSFDETIQSIMVTSANASEGKSTTSANLALALASVEQRTALIDIDFRRAHVHEIFDIEQGPGLTDLVLFGADAGAVSRQIPESGAHLRVIPTGTVPPNPASFVGTTNFLNTIDWFVGEADIVILDAPPLLAVSDAHTLGKHVDLVLLTAMAGRTTKADLLEVITAARQGGANLAGVVLLGVDQAESYAKHRAYYTSKKNWKTEPSKAEPATIWSTPTPEVPKPNPQQRVGS